MTGFTLSDNVLIPQNFGSLLYARSRHEYIPYDEFTTKVLFACHSSSLFELPVHIDKEITRGQKKAFYKLGKKYGFLDKEGCFTGKVIDRKPPVGRLLGPLTLHLSVTQQCDLQCRHCFASPEMESRNGLPLTVAEQDSIFDGAASLGCMRIALTGGEPLNAPDIFGIIDRISARGIDVCLTTNGMRIDGVVADELRKRPFAWINVSLEGATAATNDAVRGEGVFDRVVSNLKKYFKGQVRFGLSITLNRLNITEIPLFQKLARAVGAEVVMMRNIYPVGRGSEAHDLCLSFNEYNEAIAALKKIDRKLSVIPTSCEPVAAKDEMAVIFDNFGCAAGNTVATIYHNGDVSPCSLIGNGMALDNLREKSLEEIWSKGKGFTHIRGLKRPDPCRSCDDYATCSGGCRARAWMAYRDIASPDPWCNKRGQE